MRRRQILCPSLQCTEEYWDRKCPSFLSCLLDTKLRDLGGCLRGPEKLKGGGRRALVFLPLVVFPWSVVRVGYGEDFVETSRWVLLV